MSAVCTLHCFSLQVCSLCSFFEFLFFVLYDFSLSNCILIFRCAQIEFLFLEDLVYVHSNLRLLSRRNEEYIHTATKMWDIAGDSWNESDMHGGAGILENAALTLDEPELEAIVIGNVNTSATTSESEVRSEAVDLDDEEIGV